ncbi:MAG: hypothetical protein GC205_05240 [Bacteroidetes bacterium]|nr:hypothetical protein [Bacteroidota bacterium]
MSPAEDFIYQFDGNQRAVMHYLHRWFTYELFLIDKIRFRIPFYYGRTWICYMNPLKNGNVELAFIRGHELSNAQGLLESKGRKQICGIELQQVSAIPVKALNEIVQEAILLDATKKIK